MSYPVIDVTLAVTLQGRETGKTQGIIHFALLITSTDVIFIQIFSFSDSFQDKRGRITAREGVVFVNAVTAQKRSTRRLFAKFPGESFFFFFFHGSCNTLQSLGGEGGGNMNIL